MSHHNDHQIQRLRTWLLALIIVIVFAAGIAPLGVITFLERRVDQAQFDIDCTSNRNQQEQLQALTEIADQLGIPHEFRAEPLPEECR